MSNFKIIPDGKLINFDTVKKIEIERGKVWLYFNLEYVEEFPLTNEWKKILNNLVQEGDK